MFGGAFDFNDGVLTSECAYAVGQDGYMFSQTRLVHHTMVVCVV